MSFIEHNLKQAFMQMELINMGIMDYSVFEYEVNGIL
jgi:hypothetical protein